MRLLTRSLCFFSLLSALFLAAATTPASIDVISGIPFAGPSIVQMLSQSSLFDAPKVKNLNSTTWDWWYFDVVSTDLQYSAVIVFFTSTPSGLWPGTADLGTADYMVVAITGPDGTAFEAGAIGSELTVITLDDGSSGVLNGSLTGWTGSSDMSQYSVVIDAPAFETYGTISFESIAPAHFPCAPATAPSGQRLHLGPTPIFGWLNAIPDANGVVDLIINGTQVTFSGPGYHDKNWGAQPLATSVKSWYWGHGRLGPYSLVWFDFVSPEGTELVSSYLATDNKIVASTCSGMTVRPTGDDAEFPPTPASPMPAGYNITATVDGLGVLNVQVTHKQVISEQTGTLWRWIGEVSGGFENGDTWTGAALYEQFTFDV